MQQNYEVTNNVILKISENIKKCETVEEKIIRCQLYLKTFKQDYVNKIPYTLENQYSLLSNLIPTNTKIIDWLTIELSFLESKLTEQVNMNEQCIEIRELLFDWQLRFEGKTSWIGFEETNLNHIANQLILVASRCKNITVENYKEISDLHFIIEEVRRNFEASQILNDVAIDRYVNFCITELRSTRRILEEYLEQFADLFSDDFNLLKYIRDGKKSEIDSQKSETKTDKLKKQLLKYGFYELPKVSLLSELNKDCLIELISKKPMPYGIAMFDYLGFCEYLDREQGTKYKANIILSKLFNQNAKEGTSSRHLRSSLIKPTTRYKACNYKETVQKDYESLK